MAVNTTDSRIGTVAYFPAILFYQQEVTFQPIGLLGVAGFLSGAHAERRRAKPPASASVS